VSPFVLIDLIGSAGVGRSDAAGAIIPQFCYSLALPSQFGSSLRQHGIFYSMVAGF
jgi:hypothetical protein